MTSAPTPYCRPTLSLLFRFVMVLAMVGCRPGAGGSRSSGSGGVVDSGRAGGQAGTGGGQTGAAGGSTGGGGSLGTGGGAAGSSGASGTGAVAGSGGKSSSAGAGGGGGTSSSGGVSAGGGTSGSGGVAASGGTIGTGGVSGPPLPNGFKPTTVTPDDADAAYADWKTNHLEDCGGGVFRTRWENDKLDATVSEGIGYGMLLTVAHNEQAAFDGLWSYYKKGAQSNGLLNWLRYGCDAHRDTKYGQYPDGAATDADLDAAMALIMAKCRWGTSTNGTDYSAAATSLIGSIKGNETGTDNGRAYLQPGDSTWFEGMGGGCVNPSYFAPGYYRAFAKSLTNQSDKDFWNKLADDSYPILNAGANGSTGLVKNWVSTSGGTPACASSYNNPEEFGSDAARTPWRIAIDYVWSGTPAAKSFVDKITTWVKGKGIANIGLWYKLDGSGSGHPDAAKHSVIDIGAFACGAIASDQPTVDSFAAEIKNIPMNSGFDANYFSRSLRAVYLLLLTGGFTTCGGKI
ncbi:MAG TPA: glycosyl hydrolase family 8 [Polyangia bacterium]